MRRRVRTKEISSFRTTDSTQAFATEKGTKRSSQEQAMRVQFAKPYPTEHRLKSTRITRGFQVVEEQFC